MNAKFFVPYATAKMLRANGYPQSDSDMYYTPNGELKSQADIYADLTDNDPMMYSYFLTTYHIAAPTYHEVLDWLQEKGIRIEVRVAYQFREKQWSWCGYVYIVEDEDYETSQLADWSSTREGALNAAIIRALEML